MAGNRLLSGETREVRIPAGLLCSSTETELGALQAARELVFGLPELLSEGPWSPIGTRRSHVLLEKRVLSLRPTITMWGSSGSVQISVVHCNDCTWNF